MANPVTAIYCPQCAMHRRVTEPNAFGGRDRLRMTLSCGHVVAKDTAEGLTFEEVM